MARRVDVRCGRPEEPSWSEQPPAVEERLSRLGQVLEDVIHRDRVEARRGKTLPLERNIVHSEAVRASNCGRPVVRLDTFGTPTARDHGAQQAPGATAHVEQTAAL